MTRQEREHLEELVKYGDDAAQPLLEEKAKRLDAETSSSQEKEEKENV